MGPDLTRAYFWPAINKGLTWPLAQIFFDPKGKKLKNGGFGGKSSKTYQFFVEMGPDPTRAYFWPAVNKGLTHPWPRYFLIQREKIEKWGLWGETFQIQRWLWLDLTRPSKNWPFPALVKNFWLVLCHLSKLHSITCRTSVYNYLHV